MFSLMLALALSGCKGPGPCLDACQDDQQFFDACYETLLDDHQLAVNGYGDALGPWMTTTVWGSRRR